MAKLDDLDRFLAETRVQWRSWLARNHEASPGVWLVTWRAGSGHPTLAYDDAVLEALAFGWIDSKAGKVDERQTRLLMTPRRKGSSWSRPNKQRIDRLEAEGALTDAGRAVLEAAKQDGSWERLDDVWNLIVPDDLAAAFGRRDGSRAQWDSFPPSARRGILEWIVTAKRPETRAGRVEETARLAALGERANQWRPRA